MQNFEGLFSKESMAHINDIIEGKMYILKNIQDFNEKDRKLCIKQEKLENSLSEELEQDFEDFIRLTYQLEDYYFTLAYLIGMQHGKQIEKL